VHALVESILFFSNLLSKRHSLTINFIFFAFDRFAETEAVAVLSILASQFKFAIKEEPQFASETFEQRKARILSSRFALAVMWVFSVDDLDFILMNVVFSFL
jgi:integral membrane sensor domain MASE1